MPTPLLSLPSAHLVNIEVLTPPEEWEGTYTHLEVWRSVLGEGGPYLPLFSSPPSAARVPPSGGDASAAVGASVSLAGKPLQLLLGGGTSTVSYTHPGPFPVTLAAYAAALSAAVPSVVAWVDEQKRLVLSTPSTGESAILEVLLTEAATLLGLPTDRPNNLGCGKGYPALLTPGTVRVRVQDPIGRSSYYYKTRYSRGSVVGEFTAPICGSQRSIGLSASNLAVGYVKLISGGTPVPNQRVQINYPGPPNIVEGYLSVEQVTTGITDSNGYAEFTLLRGVPIDVSILGSNLIRRVVIPVGSVYSSFNLFDPQLAAEDGFGIQRIDTLYADRRTL